MALSFVGGLYGSGSDSSNTSIDLTLLSGGIDTEPQEGDMVIVSLSVATVGVDLDFQLVTSGYTRICDLFGNDSIDNNLWVYYKVMGSTPDTTVVIPSSGTGGFGETYCIHVWRGNNTKVEEINTDTGINTGQPTPPPITPTKLGSIILCSGSTGINTGVSSFTTSTLSNFISATQDTSRDSAVGLGSYSWSSGEYTPQKFGGGTTSTSAAWCAISFSIYEDIVDTGSSNFFQLF